MQISMQHFHQSFHVMYLLIMSPHISKFRKCQGHKVSLSIQEMRMSCLLHIQSKKEEASSREMLSQDRMDGWLC